MAQKESQTKTKRGASAKNGASASRRKNDEQLEIKQPKKKRIPTRVLSATIMAVVFLLLLIVWIQPSGVFPKLCYQFILGLFGRTSFYVAVPGFLLLFVIHAFSKKKPVLMRSICLGVFMLCFGAIVQWWYVCGAKVAPELDSGWGMLKELYNGGKDGITAGVICGGLGELLLTVFGKILSLIILVVAAMLTLLSSFRLTIPSILRAIENRPRPDWEDDEEEEEEPEPAQRMVDRIAQKRIDHAQEKRRRQQEQEQMEREAQQIPPINREPSAKQTKKTAERAQDLLSQIDEDYVPPVKKKDVIAPIDESIFRDSTIERAPFEDIEPSGGMPELEDERPQPVVDMPAPAAEAKQKISAEEAAQSAAEVEQEIAMNEMVEKQEYLFPPIDLLKAASGSNVDSTAEMRENSARLNETLASFRIEAHIINVTRGPSVTRYEVELDKGVRLNKLTTIADDIALSLGATGVRIAAVPGRISVVGIEVPNRAVTTVSLREVIDSDEFRNAKSKTSFSVGKDIGGNCIVGNIAKLPHMLIAGTTGSGKSVCMNSIIISLLYKASPEDVKLIMVDPKMVELGIYNAIPHLLIPVVTDPKKAAGSLQWAVTEMMRRYKAMSDAGVRDLESYNSIMESDGGKRLPQVVVIIDELADLMLVAAKEVEESICRIAQMGRASGIHLIIATQRPSADVITGLMKANIPSRIAFAVASAMESRIILDTQGAEKLVGKGDMLFAPIGSGKPLRVQGCFVSDPEVEAVTNYVKDNFKTDYDDAILKDIEKRASQTGNSKPATSSDPEPNDAELEGDDMLFDAVDVILETGQASVSMLQRRLKLGYARAARIVDEMEEKGIVGPFQGSKPRAILVTKEQWAAMRGGEPAPASDDDIPFDEGEE